MANPSTEFAVNAAVASAPEAALPTLPHAASTSVRAFAVLTAQLALVLLVAWQFQIENRTFFNVLVLSAVAFPVHAALPLAWRMPFFVALSLLGIGWVFGLAQGALLVTMGIALIGVCHLPVRWSVRIALLLAIGTLFAFARAGAVSTPVGELVWPILGSMFMFRLALYIYALRYEKAVPTPTGTLAYFFMLPNIAFPLYPVVDYLTFLRTHYDQDALEIYRTGLLWIVRGIVQLLVYRYVYVNMALDPSTLASLGDLVSFLLGTFLLYLRVSGSFHVIVGLLHLFGFRLPETHHLYFLASSFTDFWRRINIYWKDFMMKLVYYPSFFRFRARGNVWALVAATIIVFIATWILHSYQWFWLRGGFPLTAQDGLFWSVLGALVVITALREMKRGRNRVQGREGWSLSLGLSTVGTFSVICVLWSLWSAESVIEWLLMWRVAVRGSLTDALLVAAFFAGAVAVAGRRWGAWGLQDRLATAPAWWTTPAARAVLTLLTLTALSFPDAYARSAPQLATAVRSVKEPILNARDEELQHRGYYEKLDNPGRLSAQLWNTVGIKPDGWQGPADIGLLRSHSTFLARDLEPNVQTTLNGVVTTTNRWGMRDRDYSREKAPGTFRIALLGQSHVLGTFVGDDESFENVLEDRLNREDNTGRRYEILNFAVTNHSLLQEIALLEDRVLDFDPDVVIVTVPSKGRARSAEHLVTVVESGAALPDEQLRTLVANAGLDGSFTEGIPLPFATTRRLAAALGLPVRIPYAEAHVRARDISAELSAWAVSRLAQLTAERGIVPVLLALDNVGDPPAEPVLELQLAREHGVLVVDLFDVYAGIPHEPIRISSWDSHPNVRGHQLIADRLYSELLRNSVRLGLTHTAGAPSAGK